MSSKRRNLMPNGLIPELQVADVDAALAYYRDALGFSVEGRHLDESGNVVFGSVLCGSANFYFSRCDGPPAPARCWVGVGDVDALSELLAARGARIIEEVEDKPWGYRQFTAEDLNGHRLTFFQFRDDAK